MEEIVISAKSKLTVKSKLGVKTTHAFTKNYFRAKVKNTKFIKNTMRNKIIKINLSTVSCMSGNFFTENIFETKIKVSNSHKKIEEYKITNKVIIDKIDEFKNVSIVFFKLYNQKNEDFLIISDENIYLFLKNNENEIISIEQFRTMKVKDLFDEDFVYLIKDNI